MERRRKDPWDYLWELIHLVLVLAWYILRLLHSPVLLAKLLVRLGYRGLCHLQDLLSEMRRRSKYGQRNALNPAVRLPVELQIHVFSFVRSRAAFGRAELLMESDAIDADPVFWGCKDLAAARLVCRAWTDSATAVLYTDVTLVRARACVAFSRVLLARPRRALLVRRLVFPSDSHLLAAPPGSNGWQKRVDGVRMLDLKAAVDRLAVQCTNATDVTFFPPRNDEALDPGLMLWAPRLEHLALRRLGPGDTFFAIFPAQRLPHFPRLESLTLQRHRLLNLPASLPETLHTLRLGECSTEPAVLQALLALLPGLRVLFLRDIELIEDAPLVPVARILTPAQAVLTECTLIAERRLAAPRSLDCFASMQRLTISACLLADSVQMLPPMLRELIVTLRTTYESPVPPRTALFNAAQCLMHLPTWSAPSLASVQLWSDTAQLSQLQDHCVVAYMLSESLGPLGIAVAVNIFLESHEEAKLRARFQRRYRTRRLLWRHVI